MKKCFFQKTCTYSIRKVTVGVCSVLIGIFMGKAVAPMQVAAAESTSGEALTYSVEDENASEKEGAHGELLPATPSPASELNPQANRAPEEASVSPENESAIPAPTLEVENKEESIPPVSDTTAEVAPLGGETNQSSSAAETSSIPASSPAAESSNLLTGASPVTTEVPAAVASSSDAQQPSTATRSNSIGEGVEVREDPLAGREVIHYENVSVNTRVDISNELDTLRSLSAATLYMEYKQLKENPGFYNLFSVSSSTNRDEYISLFVFANGVPGLDGHNQNKTDLFYSQNYVKGPLKLNPIEWNAVAVTLDPETNKVRMYVNGVLNRTESLSSVRFVKDLQTADKVQFGATPRANSGNHWGSIFDIRNFTVYDRVLSPEEVAERSKIFSRGPLEDGVSVEGLSQPIKVSASGTHGGKNLENVGYYRIPSLLVTDKGTIIAGMDERHDTSSDWGNIDMIVKRSTDGGNTWSRTVKVLDLQTNPNAANKAFGTIMSIDMALVQDPATKRIFSVYDVFPEMKGAFGLPNTPESRYTEFEGRRYLNLYKEGTQTPYTLRDGKVYDPDGNVTDYRVVTESKIAPYRDIGDIYKGEEKIGNIYFQTNSNSPFRVAKMNYLWLSYSDDDGQTWSSPRDITATVSEPWMKFHGVGPGSGIVLHTGEHAGRIVVPTYSTNFASHFSGSQSSRVIYSDDHGETWHPGQAVNDGRTLADGTTIHSETMNHSNQQNTEASLVQISNGDLLMFMRNLSGRVQMARSQDGGMTWQNDLTRFEDVNDVYVQLSATRTIQDGQEYVILVNANGSGRNNGKIRLARVEDDGSLTWIKHKDLQKGKFAYNSVAQLSDKEYAVIYEHSSGNENDYNIVFRKFTWDYLFSDAKATITSIEKVNDQVALVRFSHPILADGEPSLTLSNGQKATFISQLDRNSLYYSIASETDWGSELTGVADGEIINLNQIPVEIAGRLEPRAVTDVQPPANEVPFESRYGGRFSDVFDTTTSGHSWVFVGGKNVQNRFDQTAGIRNHVGHFEEYIRWEKSENEAGRERYVVNAAKAGKTIEAIDQEFESLVKVYNPQVVDYMLGEEDYQKGADHLTTFKEKLHSFIEKGLALKENDGFVVIQSPHAVTNPEQNAQIALYTQAIKEVLADYYNDPRRDRIVLVDHYYHTDIPEFKEKFLKDDKLTPQGQVELARQLSYFTIKRTDRFPGEGITLGLQEVEQPKAYLEVAPTAIYRNNSLEVTVPEVDGVSEWSYQLVVGERQLKDTGLGNHFTITGLEENQVYELIVTSADGSKRLSIVGGNLVNKEEAQKVSGVTETNQKIQEKLAQNTPLTWLFMGDSITHGSKWTKGYDSVPQLFEKYLLEDLHREDDIVINTAVAGATSSDTVRQVEQRLDKYQPDVVVIMLGNNDVSTVTPEEYKANLQNLVDKAKAKNARVILRTLLPTQESAQADVLPQLVEKMREVAEENQLVLVDQYTSFRHLLTQTPYLWDPAYTYVSDSPGSHPGANGQAYLNSLLIDAIGGISYASRLGNLEYKIDEAEYYHSHKPDFVLKDQSIEIDLDKIAEAVGLPLADILVSIHKDGSNKVVEVGGVSGVVSSGLLDAESDYSIVVKAKEANRPLTHLLRTNYFTLRKAHTDPVPDLNRLIDEELVRHRLLEEDVAYTAPTVERYKNALAALRLAKADKLPLEEVENLIAEVYQARDGLLEKKEKLAANDFDAMQAAAQSGEEIEKAFDNSLDSLWHSPWDGNFRDQKLQFHLSAPVELTHFEYVPRQSGSNGRFKSGILKVTDTAGRVHEFPFSNWADTSDSKVIHFPEGLVATAMELIMNESHGSPANRFGSAAELRFVPKVYPDPVLDESPYREALANAKNKKSDEAKQGIAKVEALYAELAAHHLLTEAVLNNLIERLAMIQSDPFMDWFAGEYGDLDGDGAVNEVDVRAWLRDGTKALGPYAEEIIQETAIPFETIRRENANLPIGVQQVVQEGQEGKRIITIRAVSGRELRETVSDRVALKAVEEIIEVGTKQPAKPEESVKPTVPTKPVEAVKPTVPTKPAEPVKPIVPTKPVEPVKPVVPTKLTTLVKTAENDRKPNSTKLDGSGQAHVNQSSLPLVANERLPETGSQAGSSKGLLGLLALIASYGLATFSKKKEESLKK